jgi:hypothetical protein
MTSRSWLSWVFRWRTGRELFWVKSLNIQKKFGHLNVIRNFKIDKDAFSWPQETRGIALGDTLTKIRNINQQKAIHKYLIGSQST